MQTEFLQYITQNSLCNKSNKILLGISGGIDSICMFHLFRSSGFQIGIAHCNFQLRGNESDKDEEFVKKLADEFNIPFFSTRFNTAEIADSEGISIQMTARDLRYEWFEELRSKYYYDHISIAHNSDDVIETFLINLSRGSGIKGFSGIKSKSGNIIRPLLFASRKEIEFYVTENNFEFREDSSNSSVKYSRNLIRHEIIPLFEKVNSRFRETMIENIARLKDTENIYNNTITQNIDSIKLSKGQKTYINIDKLKKLGYISTYLHEILNKLGFSNTQVQDIANSLDSISGKQFFTLTHRLIKDRTELIIEEISTPNKQNYFIDYSNDKLELPIKLDISKFEINENFKIIKDGNIGLFDLDLIDFPLTLRKWKNGDCFIPLGMKNLKKVSDFFIDNKLSLSEKENTWIIESGNKIIWIVGKRIDERFKISNKTKTILKIEIPLI